MEFKAFKSQFYLESKKIVWSVTELNIFFLKNLTTLEITQEFLGKTQGFFGKTQEILKKLICQ